MIGFRLLGKKNIEKRVAQTPFTLTIALTLTLTLIPSAHQRPPTSPPPDFEGMPSIQTALPPEIADNVIRLYRECLRRAYYVGNKQHNTELVVGMVRQQFKKNMHEKDPEKIQQMKDDAARGLINHIIFEAEKITGRKFSGN